MRLNMVYSLLLKRYGPQHWWPTTPKGKTQPVYSGGPKNNTQILEVMIGAILTQNTSWKNVEKAIINLNKARMISLEKLDKIPERKLAEIIRPSGYFNQKAKKLKSLVLFLKANPIPKLKNLKTEKLRPMLLDVHGIGPETADSILLYALNRPIFVVDAYTKRVFPEIKDLSYNEIQAIFHKKLKRDTKLFQEYHALIVEHAKNENSKKIWTE